MSKFTASSLPFYNPSAPAEQPSPTQSQILEASLSRQKKELEFLTSSRNSSRSISATEANEKDREIRALQRRLKETEEELMSSTQIINRQQATIKSQSDTIQNSPSKLNLTPERQDEFKGYSAPHAAVTAPPRFDTAGVMSAPRLPQAPSQIFRERTPTNQYPTTPFTGTGSYYGQAHHGALSLNRYGSPETPTQYYDQGHGTFNNTGRPTHPTSYQAGTQHQTSGESNRQVQSYASSNHLSASSQSSFHNILSPAVQAPAFPATSLALVPTSTVGQDLGFTARFGKVFHMAERYSFAHVNFPSTARDGMLPTSIKEKLQEVAGFRMAGPLMSNGQTRYYVVAGIINNWLEKHVLNRSAFCGFDGRFDFNVKNASDQIYQCKSRSIRPLIPTDEYVATPTLVRTLLLSQIAAEYNLVRQKTGFKAFFYQRCRDRGNDLWAIIKPMMHVKTSKDWDDMMLLMIEAHNLSLDMHCGAYEWRLAHCKVGDTFRQETMVNKDAFMRQTPGQLEAGRAMVKLGVSPLVDLRHYKAVQVEACNVQKAMVLTKWRYM
jgi:hypothetical protein